MDILHEGPSLLQRYREVETFRRYVRQHAPGVLAALAVFLIVGMATTAAMVVFFGGTSGLRVVACLVLAPFALLGSLAVQAFVFFAWLEQRSMDRALGRVPRPIQEHLPQVPWGPAAAFLALPFFILALVSIKVAATLLVVLIITPYAYSRLDGG